jgi:hypothetical protein
LGGLLVPETWPTWFKIAAGICVAIITLSNLVPLELFERKLTRRERILCTVFAVFVLSILTVYVITMRRQ